ncbi:MAG: hypothetical protein KJO60_11530 [Desulfofustis sp.]|nr:hypothetical protein [Desulfofustis sp.]
MTDYSTKLLEGTKNEVQAEIDDYETRHHNVRVMQSHVATILSSDEERFGVLWCVVLQYGAER